MEAPGRRACDWVGPAALSRAGAAAGLDGARCRVDCRIDEAGGGKSPPGDWKCCQRLEKSHSRWNKKLLYGLWAKGVDPFLGMSLSLP